MSMNWNYPTSIWFGEKRINEIQKACLEELTLQRENNDKTLSDEEFLQSFDDYKIALQLCDAVFSHLRLLAPTPQELEET